MRVSRDTKNRDRAELPIDSLLMNVLSHHNNEHTQQYNQEGNSFMSAPEGNRERISAIEAKIDGLIQNSTKLRDKFE
jgi:hypothetical protein